MGTSVKDAAAQLMAALATVPDVTVYPFGGSAIETPALVLSVPNLEWRSGCVPPTDATFAVAAVVQSDEDAAQRLWDLVVQVSQAVQQLPNAAVVRADPSQYPTGNDPLPAYDISIEVSL